ncbi:MAG: hypothetical protein IKU60_03970 [Clostridia bacterium]|nr:hypothetical protein [Clostridia bacterium]
MKKIISMLISSVMILSLCGCRGKVEEKPVDITEEVGEDKIINLQMREADTLDPLLTMRKSVRDALLTVYEPLFNIDETFTPVPNLAQSYAFNENATVMTLRVKEGVLWHNGQPFSADDVVYTINRIKENPDSSYYLNLESVDRVEKLSAYEVVFYLKEPDAFLVHSLYFPIMRTDTPVDAMIGTGPFMLKEMDGKSISLVKNGAWHMGKVHSDGVKFVYMRTGAMAQEAFSSGKIHAVTKEILDTENFAIKESHTRHIYPDGLFEFIGFNSKKGIFSDALLRIAASNAIDRAALGNIYGDGIPSGFPVMPGSGAFTPTYEMSEYNLDYAKEVIFSSGWMDLDGNGIIEKIIDNEWTSLSFELLVADTDPLRSAAAEAVKENLHGAGFVVNIRRVDAQTYHERIKEGDYDAFLGAFYCADPYDTSQILASDGNLAFEAFTSSEIDFALSNLFGATTSDKASVAFSKLQALYIAYQPIAGLVFRTTYVVTSPYVEGEVKPYPYSPYANVGLWALSGIDEKEE